MLSGTAYTREILLIWMITRLSRQVAFNAIVFYLLLSLCYLEITLLFDFGVSNRLGLLPGCEFAEGVFDKLYVDWVVLLFRYAPWSSIL